MKIEDFCEAEIPIIACASAGAREALGSFARSVMIEPAELVAGQLRSALNRALGTETGKTISAGGYEQFWIDTEKPFVRLLAAAAKALGAVPEEDVAGVDLSATAGDWLRVMRRVALDIFNRQVPLDQLPLLGKSRQDAIIAASKTLQGVLNGRGKGGEALFKALALPLPAKTPKP
jgi:hypothetical protein